MIGNLNKEICPPGIYFPFKLFITFKKKCIFVTPNRLKGKKI